jgi:hypothetical protein
MNWEGNLRKMAVELDASSRKEVQYQWIGTNVLESMPTIDPHLWIGQEITLQFDGAIHCLATGKRIRKTYGEGMSYEAWINAPQAVESVFNPELSRIHEGVALRNKEWEEAHHNQPHVVYISHTSGLKVGVTRTTNVPSRWIDQGAAGAIVIANTPYRQLAGELEVALKPHMADKTNFRKMLAQVDFDAKLLLDAREDAFEWLGEAYESFFEDEAPALEITYPVLSYPSKIKSIRLDKVSRFTGVLLGIKGQYLLFDENRVFNVRNHAGYRVKLSW